MPRLRSRVRDSSPAPDHEREACSFPFSSEQSPARTRRGSKAVMQRIANPSRAVRLRSAPPPPFHPGAARRLWQRALGLFGLAVLGSGCTTYGVVDNKPIQRIEVDAGYSLSAFAKKQNRQSGELALVLAFSGGGTRAAALSYGVLQELRDTQVRLDGKEQRLLDAVSLISSVSGGSFTSAYYGLYGERIFDDFEERFLRRDVEGALVRGLLNPARWFSSHGRTEMAVDYYQQVLFGQATFADLLKRDGPLILINSSDLGHGVRFSFVQEYFNLLCSDLASFPLARAVTASSAVPVIFDPVVVENYSGCSKSHAAVAARGPAAPAGQRRCAPGGRRRCVLWRQGRAPLCPLCRWRHHRQPGAARVARIGRGGGRRAGLSEQPEHPGPAPHRGDRRQRVGRHAPGHRCHAAAAHHRGDAQRRHRHPAAPLQHRHAAGHAAKPGALVEGAVHAAIGRCSRTSSA